MSNPSSSGNGKARPFNDRNGPCVKAFRHHGSGVCWFGGPGRGPGANRYQEREADTNEEHDTPGTKPAFRTRVPQETGWRNRQRVANVERPYSAPSSTCSGARLKGLGEAKSRPGKKGAQP